MIQINIYATSRILYIALFLTFGGSFAQTCDSLTLDSIGNPGNYTIGSLTESDGLRVGPDYKGATIYYPTNATPPAASKYLLNVTCSSLVYVDEDIRADPYSLSDTPISHKGEYQPWSQVYCVLSEIKTVD